MLSEGARRRVMFIVLVTLTVAVVVGGVLELNRRTGVIERTLIYHPSGTIHQTPGDAGLRYEDVRFTADDGVELHGWFVPGPSDITWLWFHGNAGNISNRVGLIKELQEETGVSVFIVSYRGYGESEGSPSERGLYRDAEAALAHLLERPDVDPGRLVYFGRSLGSAVAIDLAAKHPPAALVVETPFRSLRWLARQVYPWLPVGPFIHERYPVEERAKAVSVPALVIHGDEDEVAPLSGGRAVAEALGGDTELLIVPGARHNDVPATGGATYYEAIRAFLDRAVGEPRVPGP